MAITCGNTMSLTGCKGIGIVGVKSNRLCSLTIWWVVCDRKACNVYDVASSWHWLETVTGIY